MTTQKNEVAQTCPPQPGWPEPIVAKPMALLPFGLDGPFWPCIDAEGKWTDEFHLYIQDREDGSEAPPTAHVVCIVADESAEVTQQRVDKACAKLAAGGGQFLDYSIGQALPHPEGE